MSLWRCLLPDWVTESVRIVHEGQVLDLASQVMFDLCQNQLWTAWPDGMAF